MARVAVLGGGLGGMAAAARLAKLGHDVTLLEASDRLGGALAPVRADGFVWDGGPWATSLPAALRDLFRKTGRPLETELAAAGGDLAPLPLVREHRFEDDSTLPLPGASRAAQHRALEQLSPGLAAAWQAHVDPYAETWETLRRGYVEEPWSGRDDATSPALRRLFDDRATLHRTLRRAFRDDRLAAVAGHPHVADGHALRDVPVWAGVVTWLEQAFGLWRPPAGMHVLAEALERRLSTRGVAVEVGRRARDVVVRGGRAVAVATDAGDVDADVVVCAVDPRTLPALASHVQRTLPALPPVVAHLGLDAPPSALPQLTHELVLHGDPLLVLRPGVSAPEGHRAWTVHARGRIAEDVLHALARRGIDAREFVATRIDLSPRAQVEQWRGSPHGVLWQGRRTVRQRLGPDTPVPGVYAAGAHAAPGGGVAFTALSAALVAERIGPAER